MIIKIAARGSNPYGLVNYMLGPGHHNEHTQQHTITGSVHYAEPPSKDLVAQISADLRAYAKAHPQIDPKTKHIWQASLSLRADEGQLTDEKWAQIAQDYMTSMRFTDPALSPVRWTVFRHGLSSDGNDHIHIVMSTIREDGSRVNIHNDAVRSQKVMSRLEREHGLQVLQGRGSGARPVTYHGGEKGKAHDNEHEIERVELERRIRAAAAASASEAEFVRRVRASGLQVRPRVSDGAVTGYSVAMPGSAAAAFAGGKLARDLTLPRLRQRWADGGTGAKAAEMEWLHGQPLNPLFKHGRERKNRPVPPEFVQRELAGVRQEIAGGDSQSLREIAADMAGILALHPDTAKASRDAGRWAQTEQYAPRRQQRFLNTGLLMVQLLDPNGPVGHAVMLRQVLSTLQTMYEAHRARCTEVLTGKEHGMTTAQADGIDEAAEGLAVVGVTVGARAVQAAIQSRMQQDAVRQRQGQLAVAEQRPPAPARSAPPKERDPSDWKTGTDPMTPAQRFRIEQESKARGINPDEAMPGWRQWDKATASGAITEYGKQQQQQARTAVMLTPETPVQAQRVDARAYEGPGIAGGESVVKNQGRAKY